MSEFDVVHYAIEYIDQQSRAGVMNYNEGAQIMMFAQWVARRQQQGAPSTQYSFPAYSQQPQTPQQYMEHVRLRLNTPPSPFDSKFMCTAPPAPTYRHRCLASNTLEARDACPVESMTVPDNANAQPTPDTKPKEQDKEKLEAVERMRDRLRLLGG